MAKSQLNQINISSAVGLLNVCCQDWCAPMSVNGANRRVRRGHEALQSALGVTKYVFKAKKMQLFDGKQSVLIFNSIKLQIIWYFLKIEAKNGFFSEILQQFFSRNKGPGPTDTQGANYKGHFHEIRLWMGLNWGNLKFYVKKMDKNM